jgi:hypothetical protein
MKGVRFTKIVRSSYSSDEKIVILDPDEVERLIKSFDIIQNEIFITKPVNYTEVSFRSRVGFEAACYISTGKWKTTGKDLV